MIVALRTLLRLTPYFRAIQPLDTIRYATGAPLRQIEQLVISR
jgi:hypothetical protein